MRSFVLLLLVLIGASACNTSTTFEQVEVVGLKRCSQGTYLTPLMLRIESDGSDLHGKYTILNGERTVDLPNTKKTTWRVLVGVCVNQRTDTPSYRCQEPTEWYFDQKFTYDPEAPQKLAVAPPDGGQTCVGGPGQPPLPSRVR